MVQPVKSSIKNGAQDLNEASLKNPLQSTVNNQYNAKSVNAQSAMQRKMRGLEKAQKEAVRTKDLPDGRDRYYGKVSKAKTPGPTSGSGYITEYNPKTGKMRSWMESYDKNGNINRVYTKMVDGQVVKAQHYPATKAELESFAKKAGGKK